MILQFIVLPENICSFKIDGKDLDYFFDIVISIKISFLINQEKIKLAFN